MLCPYLTPRTGGNSLAEANFRVEDPILLLDPKRPLAPIPLVMPGVDLFNLMNLDCLCNTFHVSHGGIVFAGTKFEMADPPKNFEERFAILQRALNQRTHQVDYVLVPADCSPQEAERVVAAASGHGLPAVFCGVSGQDGDQISQIRALGFPVFTQRDAEDTRLNRKPGEGLGRYDRIMLEALGVQTIERLILRQNIARYMSDLTQLHYEYNASRLRPRLAPLVVATDSPLTSSYFTNTLYHPEKRVCQYSATKMFFPPVEEIIEWKNRVTEILASVKRHEDTSPEPASLYVMCTAILRSMGDPLDGMLALLDARPDIPWLFLHDDFGTRSADLPNARPQIPSTVPAFSGQPLRKPWLADHTVASALLLYSIRCGIKPPAVIEEIITISSRFTSPQ